MQNNPEIAIVGGGAAGFFAAIELGNLLPQAHIVLFEQASKVLQKVKISGGGRCNVTNACFDPAILVTNYPRGEKALLGPFHKFGPADVMEWFENRGVPLKTEEDGRVFPRSDNSQSIIDCLMKQAAKAKVQTRISEGVKRISKGQDRWQVSTSVKNYEFDAVLLACGGNKQIWDLLENLGHEIITPVPSLFTFQIQDPLLKDLPGLSVPETCVTVENESLEAHGPLLVTHWGLSGPGILRLSAWGARILADRNYEFNIQVNWLNRPYEQVLNDLKDAIMLNREKQVESPLFHEIPKRLWQKLWLKTDIMPSSKWKQVPQKEITKLAGILTNTPFNVRGKSTFKEEFVTAGGIALQEINFKNMESKLFPSLFFAGELIDVDAITGGFNFQNAWTTAWLAANGIAEYFK